MAKFEQRKIWGIGKKYLGSNLCGFIIYMVLCILLSVITIYSPYINAGFIDNLIYEKKYYIIKQYCLMIILLNATKIIFGYIQSWLNVKLQMDASYELNKDVLKHVQRMSISYCQNIEKPYLNQVINTDANTIISFCLTIVQNLTSYTIAFVVPLIILCRINVTITMSMCLVLGLYVIVFLVMRKPLYRLTYNLSEIRGHFTTKLLEQLLFIKFIKLQAIQPEMEKRLDTFYDKVLKTILQNQNVNFVFVALDTVAATIVQVTMFVYGGMNILNNKFTVGEFTMFFSYFSMIMSATKYFVNLSKTYQEVSVSYDRLEKISMEKEETTGVETVSRINQIDVKNVSFSFDKNLVLASINMHMEVGNIYCFYGRNGAGKSTLLNLICGLYIDEFQGDIFINRQNIKNLNMQDIRKTYIGHSEQEPYLLLGSIEYNLFFEENLPDAENKIATLCSILGLNNYFSGLPNGIKTEINDTNNNLSGGEKQKLSLLRALLKKTTILALDEPTSAMDLVSTRKFMEYLGKIKKDKIIIIISHDEEIKKASDKVFYFN